MTHRECVSCGIVKPISDFEWQRNRPNPRKKCQKCRHSERDYKKEYAYRNKKRKEKYWEDPQEARRIWEKYTYGVCKEDFGYSNCWICGSSHRLCIDHDHRTRDIRGLLCSRCNTGIGMFKDNPERMGRAIEYLSTGPHYQLPRKKYP